MRSDPTPVPRQGQKSISSGYGPHAPQARRETTSRSPSDRSRPTIAARAIDAIRSKLGPAAGSGANIPLPGVQRSASAAAAGTSTPDITGTSTPARNQHAGPEPAHRPGTSTPAPPDAAVHHVPGDHLPSGTNTEPEPAHRNEHATRPRSVPDAPYRPETSTPAYRDAVGLDTVSDNHVRPGIDTRSEPAHRNEHTTELRSAPAPAHRPHSNTPAQPNAGEHDFSTKQQTICATEQRGSAHRDDTVEPTRRDTEWEYVADNGDTHDEPPTWDDLNPDGGSESFDEQNTDPSDSNLHRTETQIETISQICGVEPSILPNQQTELRGLVERLDTLLHQNGDVGSALVQALLSRAQPFCNNVPGLRLSLLMKRKPSCHLKRAQKDYSQQVGQGQIRRAIYLQP